MSLKSSQATILSCVVLWNELITSYRVRAKAFQRFKVLQVLANYPAIAQSRSTGGPLRKSSSLQVLGIMVRLELDVVKTP